MKFFFCGGSNFDDIGVNSVYKTIPKILCEYFDAKCVNESVSGGSNKRTIRKMFSEFDMNDFDYIFIDFTPPSRTEFYSENENKWIRIAPSILKLYKNYDHMLLSNLYYEEIYNSSLCFKEEQMYFTIIKKYLDSLKKPYSTFTSSGGRNLKTDFHLLDYPNQSSHLIQEGHSLIAEKIINQYKHILKQ